MIKLLLVLMMFGWAGCTQQEGQLSGDYHYSYVKQRKQHFIDSILVEIEKSQAIMDSLSGANDSIWAVAIARPTKFDPTKHYIISVDTVGFERIQIIVDSYVSQLGWHNVYDSIWQPTLDTTWADRKPLLLTPEELKKIKELLNE